MRCEQALVRVCDGLREDGEVDWQIARAARANIVRNSASVNRGLGGRGGRRTARSAAFMAHLNRPGLKKCPAYDKQRAKNYYLAGAMYAFICDA